MAEISAYRRHRKNVIRVLDEIERKLRSEENIEQVQIDTSRIAAETEYALSTINQYGLFSKIDSDYDSVNYEKYYGVEIDLEEYRKERENRKEWFEKKNAPK